MTLTLLRRIMIIWGHHSPIELSSHDKNNVNIRSLDYNFTKYVRVRRERLSEGIKQIVIK